MLPYWGINSINALFAERQCSLLKEKIAELVMPMLHYLHSQYVITYSSFRRAIQANGSNYAEIITCLSERLQTSRHVTEIGASHTINTRYLCMTCLTSVLCVSAPNYRVEGKGKDWHFHNLTWTLNLTLCYLIPSTAQHLKELLSPFWWSSEGVSGFIPFPCGNPEG